MRSSAVPSPAVALSSSSTAASSALLGGAARHLLAEGGRPAVADAAEGVEGQGAEETLGESEGQVEQEVASPGVADHEGTLPAEGVEEGDDVVDGAGDGEGTVGGRRRQAPLLEGGEVVGGAELGGEAVEILVGEARTAVEEKDGWARALAPPDERPPRDRGTHRLPAHGSHRRVWRWRCGTTGSSSTSLSIVATDGVVLITLDRPEVMNAANVRMHREMADVWAVIDADGDARVARW